MQPNTNDNRPVQNATGNVEKKTYSLKTSRFLKLISDPPPPKKNVNLVITDLDDTIWDWFGMWFNSFNPYIQRIAKECGVSEAVLKEDFRKLHKTYHTSECSYIYKELSSVTSDHYRFFEQDHQKQISILHEYYRNKKDHLKLYDGVYDTLLLLKSKGVRIVGFTESQIFYTKYRLKHLGLDGLIDVIYTIEDHPLPESVKKVYDEAVWETTETVLTTLEKHIRKPNSKILQQIITEQKGSISNTIYIGDKLDRDVFMAQKAGVFSVYAKYGHNIGAGSYDLLRDVSHWSDEDIKREKDFRDAFHTSAVKPDVVLDRSFNQILERFDFGPFAEFDPSKKEDVQKIWQKTIDVQQHFNDIELRIRNFSLTALTFILTGMGFLYKENSLIWLFGYHIQAAAILGVMGCLVIVLFYFMDKAWYHRLLLGAVYHAMAIEERWRNYLPEFDLSSKIKEVSPVSIFSTKLRSSQKISRFYQGMVLLLLAFSAVIFFNDPTENQLQKLFKKFDQIDSRSLYVEENIPAKPGVFLLTVGDSLLTIGSTQNLTMALESYRIAFRSDSLLRPQAKYMEVDFGREELRDYIRQKLGKD